jgi:glycosyltransferase involved in cell wall biosynthesis
MDAMDKLRVVLVHDWITGMRGGEKCLEVFCRRWPDAHLYTLLHKRGSVCADIEERPVHTSFLQLLPQVARYYRFLLPLMPAAISSLRLPQCDLVLSHSHCVAKSVRPPRGVPHVCYCFTPMRYAWHMREAYFGTQQKPSLKARLRDALLGHMRQWDLATADRVTHYVAISRTVQLRIEECFGRDSTVIYPPVDTDYYSPAPVAREDFYLAVSALAPYKRLDLAVETCRRLGRRLVVIGSGQDATRIRALAGPPVELLGWQSDEVIREHMRRCRALLFPGEEDFGIVPVEAMACGAPVIAFGRGGATETVVPLGGRQAPTGMWFNEQTVDCLAATLEHFEKCAADFDPAKARNQALRFNQRRFAEEFWVYLESVLAQPKPATVRRAA